MTPSYKFHFHRNDSQGSNTWVKIIVVLGPLYYEKKLGIESLKIWMTSRWSSNGLIDDPASIHLYSSLGCIGFMIDFYISPHHLCPRVQGVQLWGWCSFETGCNWPASEHFLLCRALGNSKKHWDFPVGLIYVQLSYYGYIVGLGWLFVPFLDIVFCTVSFFPTTIIFFFLQPLLASDGSFKRYFCNISFGYFFFIPICNVIHG